jgi:hypothetical protein
MAMTDDEVKTFYDLKQEQNDEPRSNGAEQQASAQNAEAGGGIS